MRLSVDFDPLGGHAELAILWAQGLTPMVFVDGKEVTNVVLADDEIGFVVVYQTDRNGNLKLNHDQDKIKTRIISGRVHFEMVPVSKGNK